MIITRHGKPTATLQAVEPPSQRERLSNAEWMERIAKSRETLPDTGLSGADLVRRMRDEGAH